MLYACPRVDPTGQLLCWVQWALPAMPWDSSELWVGLLAVDGRSLLSRRRVAGETDVDVLFNGDTVDCAVGCGLGTGGAGESVELPAWGQSQDSSATLFFISDRQSGWWSIYCTTISPQLFDTDTGPSPSSNLEAMRVLHCEGYEFGVPTWSLGVQRYAFLEDGRLFTLWPDVTGNLCGVVCTTDSEHILHSSDTADAADARGDVGLIVRAMPPLHTTGGDAPLQQHLTSFMCVVVGEDGVVFAIGGSPSLPSGIFKWSTNGAFASSSSSLAGLGELELIKSSMPNISLDNSYISAPQEITFPTVLRGEPADAHGNYYAPCNPLYRGPEGALPPLLVKLHGGPTGQASTVCRMDIQFFSSRGIAVLDVNYGGSTGFGREYRERLNGLWGVVDVEDCCRGAEFLVGQGLVDGEKLAIDGGSAGGYTVSE
jgi:hypothetical protein